MSADSSLAGNLADLQQQIRSDASNPKLRVHLFQLLCVLGQWQRALAQLQVCGQLDAMTLPMARAYREAIRCEVFRLDVFSGKRTPQVMGTPQTWVGWLIDALRMEAEGALLSAADLRARALDAAQPTACRVDGTACEWLSDGDTRLGPVCEVIVNGQYYWLPFESCSCIKLDPPCDLRDLVWAPAELVLPNEGRVPAFVPARYPETSTYPIVDADALRQCQLTRWVEQPTPDTWYGLGQKVWMSDAGEYPILNSRELLFGSVTELAIS